MSCRGIIRGIIAAEASSICLSRQRLASSGQLISPPFASLSYDTQRQPASQPPPPLRISSSGEACTLRAPRCMPLCAQITTSSDVARQRRACRTSARHAQKCKIALATRRRSRPTSPRRRGRFYYIIVSSTTASAKGSIQKNPGERLPVGVLSL